MRFIAFILIFSFSSLILSMENELPLPEDVFLIIYKHLNVHDRKNLGYVSKKLNVLLPIKKLIGTFSHPKNGFLPYCCFENSFGILRDDNQSDSSMLVKIDGKDLKGEDIFLSKKIGIKSFATAKLGVYFLDECSVKLLKDDGTIHWLFDISDALAIYCNDNHLIIPGKQNLKTKYFHENSTRDFECPNISHVAYLEKDIFIYNNSFAYTLNDMPNAYVVRDASSQPNLLRGCIGSTDLAIICAENSQSESLKFEKIFYGELETRKNYWHCAKNCVRTLPMRLQMSKQVIVQKMLLKKHILFVLVKPPENTLSSLLIFSCDKNKIIGSVNLEKSVSDGYVVDDYFFAISKTDKGDDQETQIEAFYVGKLSDD